ncbi:MAG: hypothetical protein ABFD59_07770 [Smithella sp.]|jgi:hypothetical protein
MDQRQIAKGMIEFNKSLLDNTFSAISTIQDQSAKMFTDFMDKANWLPDDGKKAINNWLAAYKKGRDDFKTATDEKYEKVANYFLR